MKILLIGNSGIKSNDTGGQTTKLRLYKEKIVAEGCELIFVDLENFFRKPFRIFKDIKTGIKACDRIVLISGERACKLLIPFINRHNKLNKKPFVLPLIGIGVLHFSIDHLSEKQKVDFLVNANYDLGKKCKRIQRELGKIDYILPENSLMEKVYREFYGLNNCYILNNFRDFDTKCGLRISQNNSNKIVYLSRVMREKGIFDILHVVKKINSNSPGFNLDIYGEMLLSKKDSEEFSSLLDERIQYKGIIKNSKVIETLSNYSLFVFPTKYLGEGTPGVIAESLIAGTPIITSNFPQAKYLLKDGFDSIFYEMFSEEDLYNKLYSCLNNDSVIKELQKNASKSGEKYLYRYQREVFLKYVCGLERK